jgi:hypothetical protein
LIAETGSSIAVVGACYKGACCKGACYKGACYKGACRKGACYKEGSISSRVGIRGRVGINGRVGIEASSSKDAFRLSRVPLLLYRASSIVYSGGVGE